MGNAWNGTNLAIICVQTRFAARDANAIDREKCNMDFELSDAQKEIVAGVRHGRTMGGPIAMVVKNRDWANWQGKMDIEPVPEKHALHIVASAKTTGPTGVEMEAMTAASVAALTIYDMVKAADRSCAIETIRLLTKSGGKSGSFTRAPSFGRPSK